MMEVCESMCLYLTCIRQAVVGGGGGQHLPAPISAVLDAAVCTFYCRTKSMHHDLYHNTGVVHSVYKIKRTPSCWLSSDHHTTPLMQPLRNMLINMFCFSVWLWTSGGFWQLLILHQYDYKKQQVVLIFCTVSVGNTQSPAEIKRKRTGGQTPTITLCFRSLNSKNMVRQIQMQIPGTDQNHVWAKHSPALGKTLSAMLLKWCDGPLSRSGWRSNRAVDEGLLV